MHPELFEIPFLHVPLRGFGLMVVIGFLMGGWLIGRLSRTITPDQRHTTNIALYGLLGGLVGARLFFVIHYFDKFIERYFNTKYGANVYVGRWSHYYFVFLHVVVNKILSGN